MSKISFTRGETKMTETLASAILAGPRAEITDDMIDAAIDEFTAATRAEQAKLPAHLQFEAAPRVARTIMPKIALLAQRKSIVEHA